MNKILRTLRISDIGHTPERGENTLNSYRFGLFGDAEVMKSQL